MNQIGALLLADLVEVRRGPDDDIVPGERTTDILERVREAGDAAQPQAARPAEPASGPDRFMLHVSLVVKEYDEAIEFFTSRLGFVLIEDTYVPEQDKRWVTIRPGQGEGTNLVLARASNDAQSAAIGNPTGGRVGFFLGTRDFERDYAAFVEAGIRFVRPPTQYDYGRVAVFEDLYGNLWDLLEPSGD